MGVGLSQAHEEVASVVRSYLARCGGTALARATLEADGDALPSFWHELDRLGWLGIHLPEEVGGGGGDLLGLAVVVEELGRAVAPGPFLPTVIASAFLDRAAKGRGLDARLEALATGERVGAVAIDGSVSLSHGIARGDAGPVVSGGLAHLLLVGVGEDVIVVDATAPGLTIEALDSMDTTRRVAHVSLRDVAVADDAVFVGGRATLVRLVRALAAAEAAGAARAVVDMACGYAKQRIAFGRPIGTFGAVKHHCVNMLIEAETAAAGAWDAAGAVDRGEEGDFAAAAAAALAIPGLLAAAKLNIQVHGGIGYTWEHDAHLYLRRAVGIAAFCNADAARETMTVLTRAGVARTLSVSLPPEAEGLRPAVRAYVEELRQLPPSDRRRHMVRSGYFVPHWPKPWGLGAGAVEQLVIDQEFEGVDRPGLAGSDRWVTVSLITFGTEDQRERYVTPTLLGDIRWCSLFSEPDAGSDAANIKTRATRVDGGWRLNGQKIWTSAAHLSTHGFATARTSTHADKHDGITTLIVRMDAEGLEIRPLRDLMGGHHFNAVFFDNVFVPDADVLGEVDRGWAVARATFGNERISIGREGYGLDAVGLVPLLDRYAAGDVDHARAVGAVLAESHVIKVFNLRQAQRAVLGASSNGEGNVSKLLAAEHYQHASDVVTRMRGPSASTGTPVRQSDGLDPAHLFFFSRGRTIGGGTSEIMRNQIGERILGLPRDPLVT